MKRYEVQIRLYYLADGYTDRDYKSFSNRKEAMKYAFTMNNNYKTLYDSTPQEDRFLWEIKVIEIKTIKNYSSVRR